MAQQKIRIMFVCLGNICRSPIAEAVFREHVRRAGLSERFDIRSTGTGHWHVGQQADRRMRETARQRGVPLEEHRGAQFARADLETFDHVFVMDKSNLNDVLYYDEDERHGYKVQLLREFDPEPGDFQVPDPYYGGPQGFDDVYEMVDRTARNLLDRLVEEHEIEPAA